MRRPPKKSPSFDLVINGAHVRRPRACIPGQVEQLDKGSFYTKGREQRRTSIISLRLRGVAVHFTNVLRAVMARNTGLIRAWKTWRTIVVAWHQRQRLQMSEGEGEHDDGAGD